MVGSRYPGACRVPLAPMGSPSMQRAVFGVAILSVAVLAGGCAARRQQPAAYSQQSETIAFGFDPVSDACEWRVGDRGVFEISTFDGKDECRFYVGCTVVPPPDREPWPADLSRCGWQLLYVHTAPRRGALEGAVRLHSVELHLRRAGTPRRGFPRIGLHGIRVADGTVRAGELRYASAFARHDARQDRLALGGSEARNRGEQRRGLPDAALVPGDASADPASKARQRLSFAKVSLRTHCCC